ncbi:ADP-ribose 1''-phosphate phophatase related protein [hydrothermal vent metagenome]|uniref:ADP-ribose 1''-phosphate phophatase related protein n=1 Tax=hydrothermal vent metagenome TaxID=652676 RepID=A0A1W1EI58_9ZZZZ
MIKIKKGNIFSTKCETIVNTVNCMGVMGAGIAYEFKLRHPDMFKKYKIVCDNNLIDIGKLSIYQVDSSNYKKILNFPTKKNWKYPSKIEYLEDGLKKFVDTYNEKNIKSIAFPLLGAGKGGISSEKSLDIMQKYLSKCDIDIEIWYFDEKAEDTLYKEFKNKFLNLDSNSIKQLSKLRLDLIEKIKNALITRDDIHFISQLKSIQGVGDIALEKSYQFINSYNQDKNLFTI